MSEMTFDGMVERMSPDIYASLRQAVERRKWPDGRMLTEQQLELCLEAVIKYEHHHAMPAEERLGHIERDGCASDREGNAEGERLKWVN
ncbi:YeaC family protein [Kushneria phosphatilytica]|uniref:DUF1315 family protein n=1 Tax=Kushneria phosphatilytica TaxID=657387 RepID=A0A1S1P279_9GAMM|nr:DUF1315 family protein [Kushneria phosphatilytica]OHV12890.1 hypothetical protein BH688_02415 [Kushneria phosphatilytica]QEL10748.1 DUF1315 family protein [Kushneria phosphatilytica]